MALLLGPALAAPAGAAVVRDVVTTSSAGATRIVVDVEGGFRYRTRASGDGTAVLVDIGEASLAPDAPRVLPVADARVDGILVSEDRKERVVRLAVDISGRLAPRLVASIVDSNLVLRFTDGSAAPVAAPAASSPPAPASSTASSLLPSVRARSVVILDPGHGGKDPGAKAWTGEYEKDIVLDLTLRVARRLRRRGDIDVVMTRSTDRYVTLEDRRDFSRRWGADAFVSIHANASLKSSVRGIETYYRSDDGGSAGAGSDRVTRRLARIENAGQDRPGARSSMSPASAPAAPLLDRRAESARLARVVQGQLVHQLGMRYETVRNLGVKQGPFFVIGDNAAPSVLVEAAFLTHREEGLRMRSEVYREQIAEGVARGIILFLEQQRRAGAL